MNTIGASFLVLKGSANQRKIKPCNFDLINKPICSEMDILRTFETKCPLHGHLSVAYFACGHGTLQYFRGMFGVEVQLAFCTGFTSYILQRDAWCGPMEKCYH